MGDIIKARDLTSYSYCQRKLYLEKVLGMKPKKGSRALKEDILAEALHYTNKLEEGVVKSIKSPMPRVRVNELYKAHYSRALQESIINHKQKLADIGLSIIETSKTLWLDMQRDIEARAENTYEFMTQNRLYSNELWWQLIPKIAFKVPVESQKLGLKAIIDRIDNYPHSTIPYHYAHGKPPEKGYWHSDRTELIAAMALLAEQGSVVHEGVIIYTQNKSIHRFSLTPEQQENFKTKLQLTKLLLTHTELPNRVENKKKCEHCIHKDQCYDDEYMQQQMAKKRHA